MNADDILFSPINNWRETCRQIEVWIDSHRSPEPIQQMYKIDRKRPDGALTLMEFAEEFHDLGKVWFWRLEPAKIKSFQFDGTIKKFGPGIPYPAYGEVGNSYLRSIEDVNLVPNTYTNYFIFRTEVEAKAAVAFLTAP